MKQTKQIIGWAAYDWANSAFATAVMTVFFPLLFKGFWGADLDVNRSTLVLGLTNSIASLAVVVSAPVLGAIADQRASKKKFLIFFAYLGVLMTLALSWLGEGRWIGAAALFSMGAIGFSSANVFYDSLLPKVAGEEKIDYVSGLGFAFGYLGGGILFAVNVLMMQYPHWVGAGDAAGAARLAFVTVGLWWGVFTIPLIAWVKEERTGITPSANLVLSGFRKVVRTFGRIRELRATFLFLVAYWFYIDGVDTIIRMAVDFGLSIGLSAQDLVPAILLTQFVGFPCAMLFGKLGEMWDAKKCILIGIAVYLFVTAYAVFMTEKYEFFILAAAVGLVQGGVQALSRSFYSRLIPPGQEAEFYGFYNMLGKFAAIIGPSLIGLTGLMARGMGYSADIASRSSIASIVFLFIIGGALLLRVDEKQGKRDAVGVTRGEGR